MCRAVKKLILMLSKVLLTGLTRRGYSLIMWAATFAALLAALALIRVPLNRALRAKVDATSDYVFWKQWGSDPKQHWRDENTQSKARGLRRQKSALIEHKSGIIEKKDAGPADNYSVDKSITSQSAKDSEALLKTLDLNQFDLEP